MSLNNTTQVDLRGQFASDSDGFRKSRIVATLTPGYIVTTPRSDVLYVIRVGMVCFKGKPLSERAKAMISIAHPEFREQEREACEKKLVPRT